MKQILLSILALTITYGVSAQQTFCGKPNPNFCPGNIFSNGDFETVTINPDDKPDQDIDVATGWFPIWQSGSLADLYCASTYPNSSFKLPTPASGVYASMWISNRNTNDATYREGMFNKLKSNIVPSTICIFLFKHCNYLTHNKPMHLI